MDARQILLEFERYFHIRGIFPDMLRWIGWGIVRLLAYMAQGLENALDQILTMGGLLTADAVQGFMSEWRPVVWLVLLITLVGIGILMMLQKIKEKATIIWNILIAIIILFGLPAGMIAMNNITTAVVQAVNPDDNSLVLETVRNNVTDLTVLDQRNFTNIPHPANSISQENILRIDINEYIRARHSNNRDVFGNKIVLNAYGEMLLEPLDSSFFDFLTQRYYRFHLPFFTVMITLIIMCITFIFTGVKIARLFYELVFKQLFASVLAFADITSGQRLKSVLHSILSSYIVIMVCIFLLRLYTIATAWLAQNLTGVALVIAIAGVSLSVIDGPNLVEKIFGIDAGLQSGFKTLLTAKILARSGTRIARPVGRGALNKTLPSRRKDQKLAKDVRGQRWDSYKKKNPGVADKTAQMMENSHAKDRKSVDGVGTVSSAGESANTMNFGGGGIYNDTGTKQSGVNEQQSGINTPANTTTSKNNQLNVGKNSADKSGIHKKSAAQTNSHALAAKGKQSGAAIKTSGGIDGKSRTTSKTSAASQSIHKNSPSSANSSAVDSKPPSPSKSNVEKSGSSSPRSYNLRPDKVKDAKKYDKKGKK